MSAIDNLKEIINLVQKVGNKELYEKILKLQNDIKKLKQKNIGYQEKIIRKDDKIKELEEKLKLKENLIFKNQVYYKSNKKGEPIGEPYCPICWDKDNNLIHLSPYRGSEFYYICNNCNAKI